MLPLTAALSANQRVLSRSPAFLGRRPASTCAEAAIPMPPQDNAGSRCTRLQDAMADGEGFEPPRPLRAFRFSRPAPSTTRPPIRLRSARPLCIERWGRAPRGAKAQKGLRHRRLPYGARTHPKARRCVNVSAVICQAALARNAPRDQLGNTPDAFALCVAMASIRAGERQS